MEAYHFECEATSWICIKSFTKLLFVIDIGELWGDCLVLCGDDLILVGENRESIVYLTRVSSLH